MKHLFLSVILGVFAFSFAFAQQRDPKAKALLDQVSSKFKSYQTVSANFAYQIQNSAGKILSKKSGVVNMKGDKYNIKFGPNQIVSDGKTVWNYDPAAKEVSINNANKAESTITPQKLFTNFYDKDFMYILAGADKVNGKAVQKVLLQPIDSKKPFSRVYLAIDNITKNIVSAMVVEKSGNKYVYSLSNFKPNASLSDNQFTFNQSAYPGVEVVDLR